VHGRWPRFWALLLCVALLPPMATPARADDTSGGGLQSWQYGLISAAGAAIIYIFVRHPWTGGPTTRGKPPAEPTPRPSVRPSPTASPSIYGHDDELVPCSYAVSDGYMQATQGVWQDDKRFDKPYVLDRDDSAGYPIYTAHYPFIKDRPAVLAGVYHYRGPKGDVYPDDRGDVPGHGHIVLKIKTNCNEFDVVRFEFTFAIGSGIIGHLDTLPLDTVPLRGSITAREAADPKRMVEYAVKLDAEQGWPEALAAFTPDKLGNYVVLCNLQHLQASTWLDVPNAKMSLHGDIVDTQGPLIHFVPVILHEPAGEFADIQEAAIAHLRADARRLAKATSEQLPDLYPLKPGGDMTTSKVPSVVEPTLDFSNDRAFRGRVGIYEQIALAQGLTQAVGSKYGLNSAVGTVLEMRAVLEKAGRIVAVFTGLDFGLIAGPNIAAYTNGLKLIYAPVTAKYTTIGHEVVHTLPLQFGSYPADPNIPWMVSECSLGYHDVEGDFAQGLRLFRSGSMTGARKVETGSDPGFMAPADSRADTYIEQCTYRHLTVALQQKQDPKVFVVRGLVWRNGKKHIGARLEPLYTLDSTVDAERIEPGQDLRVVVRGDGGRALKTVSINVLFFRPEDPPSMFNGPYITNFQARVPYVAGAREIDLYSRTDGLIARKLLSAAAPRVRLVSPAEHAVISRGKRVTIRWAISSPVTGPFYSSVLDSTNGGKSYISLSAEATDTALSARFDQKGRHLIRVVVSDGSQSGETTATINVKAR